MELYFILISFINLFLFINIDFFAKIFNIYDYPDKTRKLHALAVPQLGGPYLVISLIFYFLFFIFFKKFQQWELIELTIFLISILIIFFIGFLDDKIEINANKKMLIFIIFFSFLIFFDFIKINHLRFSFLDQSINLGNLSYFFTLLCLLLFINAFNMFDGINGQAAIYSLVIFILLITKVNYTYIALTVILFLIPFIYFNLKSRVFLGNSGSLVISFILAVILIKSYQSKNIFFADEIFIYLMIPGFDLLRLCIMRVIKKKHPFKGDRKHLHHLLLNFFSEEKVIFIIFLLYLCPIVLLFIFQNNLIPIFFGIISYSVLFTFYYYKNYSK